MLGRPRPSYGPRHDSTPDKPTTRAKELSKERWQADLGALLRDADRRFADYAWTTEAGGREEIWAHKSIVYARSGGQFQLKYLAAPAPVQHTRLPQLPGTSQVSLPSTALQSLVTSYNPVQRASSPGGASVNTLTPGLRQRSLLQGTNPELFKSILEALYTGSGLAETIAFLFEDPSAGDSAEARVEKLRKDLLYMWRSKLYADCRLVIVSSNGIDEFDEDEDEDGAVFAAHRSILCSRSPYFHSLLLDPYSDSSKQLFTLPSPPFTPASLHFSLGYLYCGTLEFANRTFNLSTAMQIWRSAQYLGVDTMRDEAESRIVELCHNFKDLCRTCVDRVGRVYAFSLIADVDSERLRRCSEEFTISSFGEVWSKAIGELGYDAQTKLVEQVCSSIDPNTCISSIRNSKKLKERLSNERCSWADHLHAMLEPIDERISKVLKSKFPAVVTSKGFLDLLEGIGFSNDVLEQTLTILVNNLQEETVAETYQVLVGQVMLREEGIPSDARVRVEDARVGVINFLKGKWVSTRQHGGFDLLENWALKELSDELEVPVEDLLTAPPITTPLTRTGLRVTPTKSSKSVATTYERQSVTEATLRASVLSRNTGKQASVNGQRGSGTSLSPQITAGTVRSRVSTLNSMTSRPRPKETKRTSSVAKAKPLSEAEATPVSPAALSNGHSTNTDGKLTPTPSSPSTPSTSKLLDSPTRPSRPPPLAPETSTSRQVPKAEPSPAASGASSEFPKSLSSSRRSATSTHSVRSTATSRAREAMAANAAGVQTLTTRAARARTKTSTTSLRSNAATPLPLPPPPPPQPSGSSLTSLSPAGARTSKVSTTTKTPVVRRAASTTSVRSEASASTIGRSRKQTKPPVTLNSRQLGPTTTSQRTKSITASQAPARLRTTSATARTINTTSSPSKGVGLSRPSSVTSVRSVGSVRTTTSLKGNALNTMTPKTSMIRSKGKGKVPPLPTGLPRASSPVEDDDDDNTPTTPTVATSRQGHIRPTTSTLSAMTLKATGTLHPTLDGKPAGSTLLIGIPCVVSSTTNEGSACKFRAVVKYLGETLFEVGQWVGVEVAERSEMPSKNWNDGSVQGVRYFELGQESKESRIRLSRTLTATPSQSGVRSEDASVNSLRPSQVSRRSDASSVEELPYTPTRGLFVRPHEVIFVF